MIRAAIWLVVLSACVAAQAQPAPRVAMTVELPVADGFMLNPYIDSGWLAVGPDGVHYVLLPMFKPGSEPLGPARGARLDLVALGPDGSLKRRTTLPARQVISTSGFAVNSLGVVVTRSGDLGIFISGEDPDAAQAAPGTETTSLWRLGPDLGVKKISRISPPHGGRSDKGSFYAVSIFLPTSDNAIMLGGGCGIGPVAWWMGKFSLNGERLWQVGAGSGFPESVAALRQRADGTWLSLVMEVPRGTERMDMVIRRHTTDGKSLSHTRLAEIQPPVIAAILNDGMVIITSGNDPARTSQLHVVSDSGRLVSRAPWPFAQTFLTIADGDGFAAIVSNASTGEMPKYVVRVDARGVVRWRSAAAADAMTIVRTPDGQIAALERIGNGLRLVRYADP